MDGIYKDIYKEEFLAAIFDKEEKIVQEVFVQKLAKHYPEFLKSHQLRKIVFGRVIEQTLQIAKAKKWRQHKRAYFKLYYLT